MVIVHTTDETMKHKHSVRPTTYLFTIRVWLEVLGESESEWRGKIQYVLTGEWHYFRDWPTLVAHLEAMLSEDEFPPS